MSKLPTLSVVIITLNEERHIDRCLKSLRFSKKTFSSVEIIVVDAQSTDQTRSIAKQEGAKVLTRPWRGYGDQKNWALGQAHGDWILSLDADEELTPLLILEMEKAITQAPQKVDGYFLKRKAFFLGQWIRHCGWWPDAQLRLIKRGSGTFTMEPVHEGLEVRGKTLELKEPMNHYTYDTIHQYLEKMNRYSDLSIIGIKVKKKRFWKFYITVAPFLTFFRMYVSRKGFLDGWHGFVVCALSAFHDFCKYAKLWENEILKRSEPHG